MFDKIRDELNSIRERDPAARTNAEVFFMYSGFHALMGYRMAHRLFKGGHFIMARWLSQFMKFTTGIEIHPGAVIGHGLFIDHGSGVVIGETTEIGDNCTIYQGVTLGGTGKDTGKRHPTIGNNVMVGSGARVLGPLKVGDNAKIGANALVLRNVPANSTAVGVPARIVRIDGKRVKNNGTDLDQIHIPDPNAQELCRLNMEVEKLKHEIEQIKKGDKGNENIQYDDAQKRRTGSD